MDNALNQLIENISEMLKNSDESKRLEQSLNDLEMDEELNSLMDEYNNLNDEYSSLDEGEENAEAIRKCESALNEISVKISNNEVYRNYVNSNMALRSLLQEVFETIQFNVTGERPCSGSCSTCSGCGN